MKKNSFALPSTLFFFSIAVPALLFAQPEKMPPAKIYYLTQQYMPREWYRQQAELWRQEISQNSQNGAAWHNYYMATEYSYLESTATTERDAKLAKILADMQLAVAGEALPDLDKYLVGQKQEGDKSAKVLFTENGPSALAKSMPGLYEFLILKWRNRHENFRWLENAYQLRPDDPETYDDMVLYYETAGDAVKTREFCERLYNSQNIAIGLLEYNYNVLMSTEKNAILFTNGDNDTFPIWVLQHAQGIRPDVTVLNIHMIRQGDYLKRLLNEKNIAVDWEKLPANEVARCLPEFCQAIMAANPNVPIYFALTVDKRHTGALANQLFVTGLASRYSRKRLDNLALLRENVENNFRLDYLQYAWYQENHISRTVIKTLNINYVAAFVMLSEYYEKRGENKQAAYWQNFATAVAREGGKGELLEHLGSRKLMTP